MQPVNTWLSQQEAGLAAALRQILADGQALEARLPPETVSFRVAPISESDWTLGRLSISHALRLMHAPLQLLVEDRQSDLGFLMRIAGARRRATLDRALQRGSIEISHGGGLGSMNSRIDELNSTSRTASSLAAPEAELHAKVQRLRLWVMFDRDGAEHDRSVASEASQRLLSACQRCASAPWGLAYHQLTRRSIENYLPHEALWQWAGSARERVRAVGAFVSAEFGELRRRCYDMKEGLLEFLPTRRERDALRRRRKELRNRPGRAQLLPEAVLKAPFQGLTEELRDRVADGYGDDIADYFGKVLLPDSWFERVFEVDSEAAVLRDSMFRTLFARL